MNVNRARSIHIPKLHIERSEWGVDYIWKGLDSKAEYELGVMSGDGPGSLGYVFDGEAFEIHKGNYEWDVVLGFNEDQQIAYTVHGSDILGANVVMVTSPHKKYNHNGGLNLVDGIKGSIPWKGDQWLGFNEKTVEFIVELDSVSVIKGAEIGFLNQNGSWIYLPENFSMYASTDGEDFRVYWKYNVAEDGNIVRCQPNGPFDFKAKYLKFVIQPLEAIPEGRGGAGYTPWTFIDEVQIDIE